MGEGYIVFLDRDGTINEEVHLLRSVDQVKLIPNAAKGIALLNSKGIKTVIVTNQPVVARGLCTEADVRRINQILLSLLQDQGATIDAVYYCPHHPETDHPEANDPYYRRECNCRKPKTGMLKQASERFGIPAERCFMIGDTTRDIMTGKNFGCTTILLMSGYAGKDGKFDLKPDYICKDLYESAKLVLKQLET